ncbi:MAG: family 43 glycosylhydrolase [Planctomycetes bacterium]|nr:family 43 glycosylhydrolase [Planctomycetota bacterium]
MLRRWFVIILACSEICSYNGLATGRPNPKQTCDTPERNALTAADFIYKSVTGIGHEVGVCRRDPSDIIKSGNIYFVWYTKVLAGSPLYPSGYFGTIWYATSQNGLHWTEQGEALGKGPSGSFDAHAVFTPGILVTKGKYYLYYTAVPDGFVNNDISDYTAIGMAESDSPHGPWIRSSANPIVKPSKDHTKFDSYRVDDSCLLVRKGRIWLYYKGRQYNRTPSQTKMGVAIAEKPHGPYIKVTDVFADHSILTKSHEVLVWPQGSSVAALASISKTIRYAPDGLHFERLRSVRNRPNAPGGYRPDAFTDSKNPRAMPWGISMMHGLDPYLRWFGMLIDGGEGK